MISDPLSTRCWESRGLAASSRAFLGSGQISKAAFRSRGSRLVVDLRGIQRRRPRIEQRDVVCSPPSPPGEGARNWGCAGGDEPGDPRGNVSQRRRATSGAWTYLTHSARSFTGTRQRRSLQHAETDGPMSEVRADAGSRRSSPVCKRSTCSSMTASIPDGTCDLN